MKESLGQNVVRGGALLLVGMIAGAALHRGLIGPWVDGARLAASIQSEHDRGGSPPDLAGGSPGPRLSPSSIEQTSRASQILGWHADMDSRHCEKYLRADEVPVCRDGSLRDCMVRLLDITWSRRTRMTRRELGTAWLTCACFPLQSTHVCERPYPATPDGRAACGDSPRLGSWELTDWRKASGH